MRIICTTVLFLFILFVNATFAQVRDTCGLQFNLAGPGCKGTLSNCLERTKEPCSLAARLDKFRIWLLQYPDKSCSTIVHDIQVRNETLNDTVSFKIDTSGVVFVGASKSPIEIIAYVSITCPLCKRLYKELHESVTIGSLKGVARLGIKPFTTTSMDLALVKCAQWKRQSDLMIALSSAKERITPEIVLHATDSLGLPHEDIKMSMQDKKIMTYAQNSRLEGERYGVKVTPTFFINGHRYKSYKDTQWVIDAVLYRNACVEKKPANSGNKTK